MRLVPDGACATQPSKKTQRDVADYGARTVPRPHRGEPQPVGVVAGWHHAALRQGRQLHAVRQHRELRRAGADDLLEQSIGQHRVPPQHAEALALSAATVGVRQPCGEMAGAGRRRTHGGGVEEGRRALGLAAGRGLVARAAVAHEESDEVDGRR